MFSTDGKWISYGSNESGNREIWVRPFPTGAGGKWQVSAGAYERSRWSNTKPELIYSGPLASRRLTLRPAVASFLPGIARLWAAVKGQLNTFDLAPDGKRVAAVVETLKPETGREPITLVLNLFDELRRKVAGGR